MWWRSSLLLFIACAGFGQTAITQLSSFWEGNISTTDRIWWDSHGSRHGVHTGAGIQVPATVLGGGVRQDPTQTGGVSIPANLINTAGSFTLAAWVTHDSNSSVFLSRRQDSPALNHYSIRLSATTGGRIQFQSQSVTYTAASSAYNKNEGDVYLIWFAYDGANVRVAVDDSAWTQGSAPAGCCNNLADPLDIAHLTRAFGRGATFGRMMMWNGYIPTDQERAAIWNNGTGRPYTYFNAVGFTPPSPLTVTDQGVFADDANLVGQQGLYFLRPYPLKFWKPSFVAGRGDYIWARSTDHQASGAGGVYIGYSNSPATLPASWTLIKDATALSTETGAIWSQLETPYLAYSPETDRFHLYAHAIEGGTSNPIVQATHCWTSSNLTTWTYHSKCFPTTTGRNHTGYAIIERRGPGDWIANTLLTDSTAPIPSLNGLWTSTDGLAWTLVEAETATAQNIFSSQLLPYVEMSRTQAIGLGRSALIALNYAAYRSTATGWAMRYPPKRLFEHDGSGTGGNWLQDVKLYEEDGQAWLYAKWSFQEPSTVRLFTGTLTPGWQGRRFTQVDSAAGTRAFNLPTVSDGMEQRVYFAATFSGLGASTSYCVLLDANRCWLDGVEQASSSLDLTALPFYQVRYYDRFGRLVSNPGTFGQIR